MLFFRFNVVGVLFKSRLLLAVLHYNNNSNKQQAKTKKGEDQYSISFPKYKKGDFIVREVMEKSNYGWCNATTCI